MLEEYSLALEVGPSQVVQGERGLFIRVIGHDVEVRRTTGRCNADPARSLSVSP